MWLVRFFRILWALVRLALAGWRAPRAAAETGGSTRGLRVRRTLESLGPLFVKFGQVLSTRQDLLPADLAVELQFLQDRVRPFPSAAALSLVQRAYGRPVTDVFASFDPDPVAAASVAQVHFATLHDGTEVAVKILRPGIRRIIDQDLRLMALFARFLERVWADGRRLKLSLIVQELAKHLDDELDLMREAANASQLRRNFAGSDQLVVPEVHWDYCLSEIMVMQRMHGTPISQVEALEEQGLNRSRLGRAGVEIFFTQVFRDGFFHADMHPGNILVNDRGQYVALDFGIMGTLTDEDRNYLAQNFLAFFNRDYKRVAQVHIDAGWAPAATRVDEFEAAIRAVCEPIFDRPLKDISFGKILLRLFQTSRRFGIEIQPQLVLLQKTLLNIEGLGRSLDPNLDLWDSAKPFLERWMEEQIGWRGLVRALQKEAPYWSGQLPQIPRLIHGALILKQEGREAARINAQLADLLRAQRRANRFIGLLAAGLAGSLIWVSWLAG